MRLGSCVNLLICTGIGGFFLKKITLLEMDKQYRRSHGNDQAMQAATSDVSGSQSLLPQEHLLPILMSEEYIAKTVTVVPAAFSSKED